MVSRTVGSANLYLQRPHFPIPSSYIGVDSRKNVKLHMEIVFNYRRSSILLSNWQMLYSMALENVIRISSSLYVNLCCRTAKTTQPLVGFCNLLHAS